MSKFSEIKEHFVNIKRRERQQTIEQYNKQLYSIYYECYERKRITNYGVDDLHDAQHQRVEDLAFKDWQHKVKELVKPAVRRDYIRYVTECGIIPFSVFAAVLVCNGVFTGTIPNDIAFAVEATAIGATLIQGTATFLSWDKELDKPYKGVHYKEKLDKPNVPVMFKEKARAQFNEQHHISTFEQNAQLTYRNI